MQREVRVSPDGNKVAIRTNHPEGAWNAWGCFGIGETAEDMDAGGHWNDAAAVDDWEVVVEG